jgi:hypothetical protein
MIFRERFLAYFIPLLFISLKPAERIGFSADAPLISKQSLIWIVLGKAVYLPLEKPPIMCYYGIPYLNLEYI